MMRTLKRIIVHHSASDNPKHDDISIIRDWHVKENGWADVGYHFFIKSDGTLQYGREIWRVGSHCRGHNMDSIGICLHGDKHFSREQFAELAQLCWQIQIVTQITEIRGHSYYDHKNKPNCPGFDVFGMIKHYNPDIKIL